jgi:hypothetical protein
MNDLLLHFCEWLQATSVATTISHSLWMYPFVQLIHFTGLSLWVGTIAIVDLRFLGLTGRHQNATLLAEQLLPWTWTGLGIAILGGFLLLSASATTYLQNAAFRVKIPIVLTGILYHIVVQQKMRRWGSSPEMPTVAKLAAFLELAVWIGVVTAAVEIPNN